MIAACLSFTARNSAQACRLETDGNWALSSRRRIRPDNVAPGEHKLNEADDGHSQLGRTATVPQWEGKGGVKAAKVKVRLN